MVAKTGAAAGDLPGVPKKRGRPATGTAMTDAERQKKRRAKLAAEGKEVLGSVVVSKEVREALSKYVEFKDMTLGDAVDRILRDRLLRKR